MLVSANISPCKLYLLHDAYYHTRFVSDFHFKKADLFLRTPSHFPKKVSEFLLTEITGRKPVSTICNVFLFFKTHFNRFACWNTNAGPLCFHYSSKEKDTTILMNYGTPIKFAEDLWIYGHIIHRLKRETACWDSFLIQSVCTLEASAHKLSTDPCTSWAWEKTCGVPCCSNVVALFSAKQKLYCWFLRKWRSPNVLDFHL